MSHSHASWLSTAVTALALVILGGCDAPTGTPSINTETALNTPLVQEKTFTFLGGPKSDVEPLIDTTTSEFDSLFTVDSESKDISVVQEIDDFDIGSLEGTLDEAAGDLAVSNTFEETLIGNGDLITQEVSTAFEEQNDAFTNASDPGAESTPPIFDQNGDNEITVDFPAPGVSTGNVLPAPQFGAVDATGATVLSVTPTDANTDIDGPLNEITFTLTNRGTNELTCDDTSAEITCSSGEAPVIVVEGADGSSSNQKSFGTGPLGRGASATATVDVSTLTLGDLTPNEPGNEAQYRLFMKGTNSSNTAELEIDLTRFEYQEATVNEPENVEISASATRLGIVGGDSNFEALTADQGTLSLEVERGNSGLDDFSTNIGNVSIQNVEIPGFAPSSFSETFIDGSPGGNAIDVAGRDLAQTIDIDNLTATPEPGDPLTLSADDVYTISIDGTVRIQTLYFRPDGEMVQTEGTVSIQSDQVDLQKGDLVEVTNALIETEQLDLQPDIAFDTLTFNYPDLLRGPDFQPEDSLQVRFVQNPDPDDPFEFDADRLQGQGFDVTLDENLQIRPDKDNAVRFRLSGRLVDASDADVRGPDVEGIASAGDGVQATTTIGDFGIQKIDVSDADRFTVDVTSDENGDGQLNLADDTEAETASFDGFEGISDQVDDLELADTNLDFSVTTRNLTKADAQLYAAIQGKNETESTFLAGEQGPEFDRSVSSADLNPFEAEIVNGSSPVPAGSLIGFEVEREDASLGASVSGQSTSNSAPLPINNENSNVSDFVNTLPTEIRFAGQAEMNTGGGALRLQAPIELDAGFMLNVPLHIKDRFVLRDTIEEDLSDLEDVTDPEEDLSISTAELQFSYTNGLPLGVDVKMIVVDQSGAPVQTFNENFDNPDFRLKPAPKETRDGPASGTRSGEFVFNLGDTQEQLRTLADGEEIRLELNMDQDGSEEGGAVARLRADDQLTINQIRLNVKASIQTGN